MIRARGFASSAVMASATLMLTGCDYDTDPGWYENPQGTEAKPATTEELQRDGIDV